MAIRERISSKTFNENVYIRRMLRVAIAEQQRQIATSEEFGDNEIQVRAEHAYLSWLEQQIRHDGTLSIVRS